MADSKKIHLWPEELKEQEGQIISGFILEIPNNERKQIWYRLPIESAPAITRCCDPFVLAALFISMSTPADLIVHGEVSPSLLFKLKEFQAAWSSWLPDRYASIDIISDSEQEQSKHDSSNALMTFSGGVDSCFTAWRYNKPGCESFPYHLKTCLVVHGFDFPPQHEGTFSHVLSRSRSILDSVGMTLIPITTNLRTINQIVDYTHGAFLASCLTLLREGFAAGVIASSFCYEHLYFPYGSNPLTDLLLSSNSFPIIHDGAKFKRLEKVAGLSDWPEALSNLRVCLGREASKRDKNCCRCEKCVRTILNFRALDLGLPSCFEQDVTNRQIIGLRFSYTYPIGVVYEDILAKARARKMTGSWIRALQVSIGINKLRSKVKKAHWFKK